MPPQPIVNPSVSAKKYGSRLKVIMICELALGILYMTASNFMNGIFELLMAYILWKSVSSYNFCMLILYEVMMLSNFFSAFCSTGNLIQHELYLSKNICSLLANPVNCNVGYLYFKEIVVTIGMVFYAASMILTFYGYREFKALYIEQGSGQVAYNNEQEERNVPNNNNNRDAPQNNRGNAFQGRGVVVG